MGKRSQRLATRRQENNTGCMSGLMRMFYFRPDAKLLLDRKQGSRRHTFSGFAGRGHFKSREFEEIDEDLDNMEECSSGKPTVKRLMENELGQVKQLKIPNDEVQRILADLGHDVCLDNSSVKNSKSKGDQNHNTRITVTSPSGSLDPNGFNCMKEAKENELELALADFLGQIQRCHDEWPHKDCKNKSDLCTELKSIIQTKLEELNNPPCSLAYEQTSQSAEKDIANGKQIRSSREGQPKKFRDALEMLSSDTELLLKIIQKPNSHILENIQRHQHRQIATKVGPAKTLGNTDSGNDIKSPNQHELATKTHGKERKHIFFWKKERLNNGHTEGANSSQPVNKIVILKPNPRIGIDPTVATSPNQAPELSAAENSKFSIKEVRRRFRIVASEARKGRPSSVHEDNLQKDPHLHKSSAFTIKKDTRQLTEKTSAENASSTATKDIRSSTSSRQKQMNGESMFYEEAKKHLTEILKDKSQAAKYPTLQISRTLVRMLSQPQCSTASPTSSPRAEGCIEISSEEANICAIHKAKKVESTKESQSRENSMSVACSTSEALHEKAVQERHHMKEESEGNTLDDAGLDTASIEETDKLDRLGTRFIPEEQFRYNPSLKMLEEAEPGKKYVGVFPSSPENVVDEPEYQEPATPRSNASIGLISQFSPEGNHEKQEQPSPVSVLDPFFHEDVDNPDNENMVTCELQEDILRTRYTVYDVSDQGISWDDEDVRLSYIKAVLELSELCAFQNLEVWYLEDELISPCLFEELYQGSQIHDAKLLFDCICEVVTEIQRTYFRSPHCSSLSKRNIKAPPMGQNLISEINKQVERHLHYQFPSTLDQLINLDLKVGNWMDLQTESEEITVEIWDFILDDLLEEVVYNLWI